MSGNNDDTLDVFAPFCAVVRNNVIHRDRDDAESVVLSAEGRRPSFGDHDGMTVLDDTTNDTLSSTVIDLERDLAKTRLDETLSADAARRAPGHVAAQRPPKPRLISCCEKVFADDAALDVHRASLECKRPKCPHCDNDYASVRYAADHIVSKHVKNGDVIESIRRKIDTKVAEFRQQFGREPSMEFVAFLMRDAAEFQQAVLPLPSA